MDGAYNYNLPADRIAQRPVRPYDSARLLIVDRVANHLTETTFCEFDRLLRPGDLLVFNDSRVLPARLTGRIASSGGAIEVVLHRPVDEQCWRCLGRPLKRFKPGVCLIFGDELKAQVLERCNEREVILKFSCEDGFRETNDKVGVMPIPPYIRAGHADDQDRFDYQSMFAQSDGSVAAPTASLHFTSGLLDRIRSVGVSVEYVTLHVGIASFLPLWRDDDPEQVIPPAAERCRVEAQLWEHVQQTKTDGGRVIAVGTTVVRALEGASYALATAVEQEADIFITPGYKFKVVDALVTNFHQPRTTHLLLVQALLGAELLDEAYQFALRENFRFLSYGDGMFIV